MKPSSASNPIAGPRAVLRGAAQPVMLNSGPLDLAGNDLLFTLITLDSDLRGGVLAAWQEIVEAAVDLQFEREHAEHDAAVAAIDAKRNISDAALDKIVARANRDAAAQQRGRLC